MRARRMPGRNRERSVEAPQCQIQRRVFERARSWMSNASARLHLTARSRSARPRPGGCCRRQCALCARRALAATLLVLPPRATRRCRVLRCPRCPRCALPSPARRVCGAASRAPPPSPPRMRRLRLRVSARSAAAGAEVPRRARLAEFLRARARRRASHGRPTCHRPAAACAGAAARARLQPGAGDRPPRGRRAAHPAGCAALVRVARHAGAGGAAVGASARATCAARSRALPAVRGRRIALVDDVMTTGATLAEAARAPRLAAGRGRVECWVVARTLRGRSCSTQTDDCVHADVRRRARRPRDPAEHGQRHPPHRQHGHRAASRRAARLSHGRPRSAARGARLSRIRAGHGASRLARLQGALGDERAAPLVRAHDARQRARSTTRASRRGDVLVFGCETVRLARRGASASSRRARAWPSPCARACAASTCPTRSPSPSTRRGGSRVSRCRTRSRRGASLPRRRGSRRSSSQHRPARRQALVQHAVHRLADRHLDAVMRGERAARRAPPPRPRPRARGPPGWPAGARPSRQREARRGDCARGRRCR